MKNIKKISIILILVLAFSILLPNFVKATDIISSSRNFLEAGNDVDDTIKEDKLQETSSFIFNLLFTIGVVVMFIVGTIIGIQFMIASAEDKAKVKEALVPYFVGCIVIFGAFTIWSVIVNILQKTF